MKQIRLTTDAVITDGPRVLLVKRGEEPFKGKWALPGGFVEYGERAEEAIVREVREETGLDVRVSKLIGVYSDPRRDPRGHTVTVAYICEPKAVNKKPRAGDDAAEAKWWRLDRLPKLAFDHAGIVGDAKKAL
jgi:8-oxo-dGTP diphosphatase